MTSSPRRPLAYYDSFGGLIPCVVDRVTTSHATITISASRPGYPRGERMEVPLGRVIPRDCVKRSFRVMPHTWGPGPDGNPTWTNGGTPQGSPSQ